MSESVVRKGIGVSFDIDGQSRSMVGTLGKLSSTFGGTVSQENLHVTLVGTEETIIDMFSERDTLALERTYGAMYRNLARISLKGVRLSRDKDQDPLEKYGKYFGVPLLKDGFLEDIREKMSEIVDEGLGIQLRKADFEPHIALIYRGNRRKVPARQQPSLPNYYSVRGFSTMQQIFSEDPSRQRSRQVYKNGEPRRFKG
jgi:2'-5' RNA ligase